MSSHSILPNSASANHSAAQAAAMTSPSPSHSPVFGGGKIAGVVIAGAVVLILLAILLGMYIRRLHNRQQDDDDEYWCRGKPEDLERIPSHSQRTQSTELREMVHAQSALSPVLCSAGGSHRTERTLSPHSDSGYGPSPVSTIKSSHATARSFSLVRPTLVDLPAQRPVSRMSRLVSGQVVDSSAVRSTPSMSFTSELSTSLRSCPSGSTPLPRKSSSTSPIRPNAPAGLFLLPVSAASPDGKSFQITRPLSTLTQHSSSIIRRRAADESIQLYTDLLRSPHHISQPRSAGHKFPVSSALGLDSALPDATHLGMLRHDE